MRRRNVPLWVALACATFGSACSFGYSGRFGESAPSAEKPDAGLAPRVCDFSDKLRLAMPDNGTAWRDGWEQLSPSPFRGDVMAIGGLSATDLWWTGRLSPDTWVRTIAHFDGARTRALIDVGVDTWPIGVVSADEIWLGPHLRWVDGALERSPASAPGTAAFRFFGSKDGWSVGSGAFHWDGNSWTRQSSLGSDELTAVDGSGPNDVWVAGVAGMFRWDGTNWSPAPSLPRSARIHDVRVVAVNDVWAVGSSVFHYDGTAWTEHSSSIGSWQRTYVNGSRTYFLGSGAIGRLDAGTLRVDDENAAPCNAFASNFGLCREAFLAPTGELFVATDASESSVAGPWRRPVDATTSKGTSSMLTSLAAGGPSAMGQFRATGSKIFAVDAGKAYLGQFGSTWAELAPPRIEADAVLSNLSGLSGGELWLTFRHGNGRYATVRYDGTRFGVPALLPEGFVPDASCPYSFDASSAGCNGRMGGGPGPDTRRSLVFDGTKWTQGTSDELVLSPTNRFRLVREDGNFVALERLEGARWVRQPAALGGRERSFLPLMATGPNDVLLMGEGGSLRQWDGSHWTELQAADPNAFFEPNVIYLGNGRTWVSNRKIGQDIGVVEKGCFRFDGNVDRHFDITGNAERIFAYGPTPTGPELRTRTFTF